jgi:WD40 repeat protein
MIVASAGKDFTVRLWNIRISQCLAIFGGVSGHRDQILSLVKMSVKNRFFHFRTLMLLPTISSPVVWIIE